MIDGDILIVAEHHQGHLRPISLELVTAARRLADETGGKAVAAVLGDMPGRFTRDLDYAEGLDHVVVIDDPALDPFVVDPWVTALEYMIEQVSPGAVLIPGTITGRDYAPRLAARFDTGFVPDAIDLAVEWGALVATRAVLGGRVQTDVRFLDCWPPIVTVAPGSFPKAPIGSKRAVGEVLDMVFEDRDARVRLDRVTPHVADTKGITEAERIVSGGRGLGKAEHFALIEELAAELDAAVGASGATVGAGWRSHADQVGSTGHIVSPRLYLAVGISGAPQHLVGMQGSDVVVAINRDPEAPIFRVAQFGIVGDLFEVIPALIAELRAAREQAS